VPTESVPAAVGDLADHCVRRLNSPLPSRHNRWTKVLLALARSTSADLDPAFAHKVAQMQELGDWWKAQMVETQNQAGAH
jgi:hypothetical protein